MRHLRHIVLPALVVLTVCGLVAWTALRPFLQRRSEIPRELDTSAARIDRWFEGQWAAAKIEPAELADELQVLRRLSLALHGTVPALEEIRSFESDSRPDRLRHWTARMIADKRFGDYFAKQLARGFLGEGEDKFPAFQRERFVTWLATQLQEGRPFDATVREMIADRGTWTDSPATHFITAEIVQGELYPQRLAGRTARAFLGQRIDCAQCHNHPFASWKQADFEGLAAYFGHVGVSTLGVRDRPDRAFTIEDRGTLEQRPVSPRVPFHDEWLTGDGAARDQLARWVTHEQNRRFRRAIANRVWGAMFGRPYHSPVDDLPDPSADQTDLLDILGDDFRDSGYDVRQMIQAIAASRPFRLASAHPQLDTEETANRLEAAWAVFPLTALRPDQQYAAMKQAASPGIIVRDTSLFASMVRFHERRGFAREYGDPSDEEMSGRVETIPQILLRMNGKFTRQASQADLWNSAGRIAAMAGSDAACVEACYLACLMCRPIAAEEAHFLDRLDKARAASRQQAVEDIFWALFNSPEFSWSH